MIRIRNNPGLTLKSIHDKQINFMHERFFFIIRNPQIISETIDKLNETNEIFKVFTPYFYL